MERIMKQPVTVTDSDGNMIVVDIADEVCMRFGFRHGTRILDPDGEEGIVMGVAPAGAGEDHPEADVLWYRRTEDDGVVYWSEDTDLVAEGFTAIGERRCKCSEVLVYALRSRITAMAGAAGMDTAIVRNDVALEQARIFREAGYTDVRIEMVRDLVDEDGSEYLITKLEPLHAPASETIIPAKYRAEHINPCINVYDYDRDVLKRPRMTLAEAVLTKVISMALFMGALLVSCGIVLGAMEMFRARYALAAVALVFFTSVMWAGSWFGLCVGIGEKIMGIPSAEE